MTSVNDLFWSSNGDGTVMFKGDNTGVTDVTSQITALISANPGKIIKFSPGKYRVNNLYSPTSLLLDLTDGVTFIYDYGNRCILQDNSSYASASQAISAASNQTVNTDAYVTRLTVSDASVFSKGDVVHIHSNNLFRPLGEYIGGSHTVHSVDVGNNYVYLNDAIWYLSELVTSPLIRKYDTTRKVEIKGGTFRARTVAEGEPKAWNDDSTTATRYACIEVLACPFVSITGTEAYNLWRDYVLLRSCPYSTFANNNVHDLPDFVDAAAALIPGYGIDSYGACRATKVHNNTFRVLRHGYTTGGQENSTYNAANWDLYGIPSYDDIFGNLVDSANGTGLDTHEPGYKIRFRYNTINGGNRGYPDGSSGGAGIAIRAHNVEIIGNVITDCKDGIVYLAPDLGRKSKHTIKGNVITRLASSNATDVGINLSTSAALSAANRPEFILSGNSYQDLGRAIQAEFGSTITVLGDDFVGCDRCVDSFGGSSIILKNCSFDFRNSLQTAPHQLVMMRGSASGQTYAAVIDCILYKGPASNTPAQIFEENDTTGTLNYYVHNFREWNPSGVTATVPTEAGATTFTPWTALTQDVRVHTAAGAVTVVALDTIVVVNKGTGAATVVNLPSTPVRGKVYTIKDGKGDAATNNITLTPASGTIDGAATLVLNTNYQVSRIVHNGTQWNSV